MQCDCRIVNVERRSEASGMKAACMDATSRHARPQRGGAHVSRASGLVGLQFLGVDTTCDRIDDHRTAVRSTGQQHDRWTVCVPLSDDGSHVTTIVMVRVNVIYND